jgi:hypothetical protein
MARTPRAGSSASRSGAKISAVNQASMCASTSRAISSLPPGKQL